MLYSIENREDLGTLEELASLENQVKDLRLQDKLGKQNFHEDIKKLYEPLTDTIKNTSEDLAKTTMLTAKENNQAISDLNEKVLEMINDTGMIAPYLPSTLVNIFEPENTSQFKLIKDPNSIKMNDFLINTSLPVTLYSNMLTFRDSNKSHKLGGDLLKTITNYDFNVTHSNLQDQNIIYEFGKEMNFNIRQIGRKRSEERSLAKLLKSPAIMASRISTIFLPDNPNEL